MKIDINLASQPFRRNRAIFVGSIATGVLMTGVLIMLILMAVSERGRLRDIHDSIDDFEKRVKAVTAEQAKLDATLRKPQNAEVLERNLLLNTLIERKSISWTRIFGDLEKVMPFDVALVSVRLPQINSQNQVLLDMVVGASGPEPVIALFRKLEQSPLFGPAFVQSSQPPSQTDPLYRYRITVTYAQKL